MIDMRTAETRVLVALLAGEGLSEDDDEYVTADNDTWAQLRLAILSGASVEEVVSRFRLDVDVSLQPREVTVELRMRPDAPRLRVVPE